MHRHHFWLFHALTSHHARQTKPTVASAVWLMIAALLLIGFALLVIVALLAA